MSSESLEISTRKTKVDDSKVLAFLRGKFSDSISSLQLIKGGEHSRAFLFEPEDRGYVIRVDGKEYSFEKDKYAHGHFGSQVIPISKILEIGKFDEKLFYAISEQARGKNLDEVDATERERLLPQLITTLDAIHLQAIDPTQGYGYWDGEGQATDESYKKTILSFRDGVLSKWDEVHSSSGFERDFFDKICQKVAELIHYVSEERFLVHGDYGFNNVMTDGQKITGILDWGEGQYGDFLYDVAWLQFYSKDINYADEFEKYYRNVGRDIPHFRERLLLYQLHIGVSGAERLAISGQTESYKWQRDKTLALIAES